MRTMDIKLTADVARFVDGEVASGRYASASELVSAGLRVLERERALEAEKEILLRSAVQAGLADVEAGRFSERSVGEIAAAVLAARSV